MEVDNEHHYLLSQESKEEKRSPEHNIARSNVEEMKVYTATELP
jgi:hypothetical protein